LTANSTSGKRIDPKRKIRSTTIDQSINQSIIH